MHECFVMGGLATLRQNSKDMKLLTSRVPKLCRPSPDPGFWLLGTAQCLGVRPLRNAGEAAHSPSSQCKDI